MSDTKQRIVGDSQEAVAYYLMTNIAICEGKTNTGDWVNKADREWILNTYAQCLSVIKGSDARSAMNDYPVT